MLRTTAGVVDTVHISFTGHFVHKPDRLDVAVRKSGLNRSSTFSKTRIEFPCLPEIKCHFAVTYTVHY